MIMNKLDNLPDISILEEENITLEGLQSEMIADYEQAYKEETGEAISLYPGNERRIELLVVAGALYQLAVIMNERYRMNFLQNMYGDALRSWTANFGFTDSGKKRASVRVRFFGSKIQDVAVGIPAGTRVTAGDNVFFETAEYAEIAAGEEYADVTAICTTDGTSGNGYRIGQIAMIVDPVNMVGRVENITVSDGGHDEYTDEELRALILDLPSTYSTAGPEEAYIQMIKGYSERIVSVRRVRSEDAIVRLCIMCADGEVPDENYCAQVQQYIMSLKRTPDTDKIEIIAPEVVAYELDVTFYISDERKDIAESIKNNVEDAVESFVRHMQENIGYDINTDLLRAYANAAGARRILIESPEYQIISENQIAICTKKNMKYGGLEGE